MSFAKKIKSALSGGPKKRVKNPEYKSSCLDKISAAADIEERARANPPAGYSFVRIGSVLHANSGGNFRANVRFEIIPEKG